MIVRKGILVDKKDEKLVDFAKLWLAHDGLWFQAIEKKYGIEEAIELDKQAWSMFSPIEAKRIMARLGMKPGGGIEALVKALGERLYEQINEQEVIEADDDHAIFMMKRCRVQDARQRKGMASFPCKDVGLVEYTEFARAIDPRIETKCITCPPDDYNGEYWCMWEFSIDGK
ncbi:MAG: L-2-amino-thiazoline-4-carboxylic acid hydrolase [candidate division Zixibacteria bacterium]|nr:L-2-amino-thiazoline-4-carboxylic acid hydrolase [candidate division Zixibacteria bacterium]